MSVLVREGAAEALCRQPGSSWDRLSGSSWRGSFPKPKPWRPATRALVSPGWGVGGAPQTSDPPNSTQGPGCWLPPRSVGSGWAVLLCTLSADKGKKILPQSHSLVQAIETNVPQKTQYPLTLAPSTDHQPPSERSLAQDKCHTDLLGEVAQQLTHGTNRGVTR